MSSGEGSPPGLPLLPDQGDEDEETPLTPPLRSTGRNLAKKYRVANKICRVCGDKALGYNFNVVTCESCKAFFRRNATANKNFRCPFTDNCEVNIISRRMCQKCRLRKCFEAGMKKEWILSEEAKRRKRTSRGRSETEDGASASPKRPRPDPADLPSCSKASASGGLLASMIQVKSEAKETSLSTAVSVVDMERMSPGDESVRVPKQLLLKLMECHGKASGRSSCTCSCTCGFYPKGTRLGPPKLDGEGMETGSGRSETGGASSHRNESLLPAWIPADLAGVEPVSMEDLGAAYQSIVDATISNELTASPSTIHIPPSPATPGSVSVRITSHSPHIGLFLNAKAKVVEAGTLTSRDQRRLDELVSANEVMKEAIGNESRRLLSKESLTLTDLVNMTDIAVRRIIQMCKKISGFRGLCQEDQIALLKGSCTEMMILRGLMTYDAEKDVWKGPDAPISCDVLKGVKGGDAYVQHKRWLSSFQPEWRANETLMLILGMVTLFNPTRPHITHPAFVQQQQDIYYALLKKYLGRIMPSGEAAVAYRELCQRILALHSLNETIQKIFLDVNPKDVEPLLIEIFDLK